MLSILILNIAKLHVLQLKQIKFDNAVNNSSILSTEKTNIFSLFLNIFTLMQFSCYTGK